MEAKAASPSFLVYGAGAVGSLLGGRLASSGQQVTLLCRPAARRVIRETGLRIDDLDGSSAIRVTTVSNLADLDSRPDVVLLTIKAYDVVDALPDLLQLARSGATIFTIQNGVGTEERLREISDIHTLIAGSLTISVTSNGPGHVRQETSDGGMGLAAVRDPQGSIDTLRATIIRAGIPASILADYRQMKWSKLLLNILANATSAILATDPGTIFADPALFNIEQRAFIEAVAVMAGQGLAPIELPGFNVPLLVYAMRMPAWLGRRLVGPRVAGGRGDKRPSLWVDIDSGREQTEIAWLNGAILTYGDELGIPVPVNRVLTRLVDEIAHEPERRQEFAGHPRKLVAALDSDR